MRNKISCFVQETDVRCQPTTSDCTLRVHRGGYTPEVAKPTGSLSRLELVGERDSSLTADLRYPSKQTLSLCAANASVIR